MLNSGLERWRQYYFMQGALKVYNETKKRKYWVADSFAGFPIILPTLGTFYL
tara:strand:- start:19 stop:174 length:156 start_codon:yes stop_codon:yes gene_type:complete